MGAGVHPLTTKASKWVSICVNCFTMAFGFVMTFYFSLVMHTFQWECVLGSKLVLADTGNKTLEVNEQDSKFEDPESCWFPFSAGIVVIINTFTWNWFLFLLKESIFGGPGDTVLFIFMWIYLVVFCCSFACSVLISRGRITWCSNMVERLKGTVTCSELVQFTWGESGKKFTAYRSMTMAEIFSWLMTLGILLGSVAVLAELCLREKRPGFRREGGGDCQRHWRLNPAFSASDSQTERSGDEKHTAVKAVASVH